VVLKGRLRNLERAAEGGTMVLVLQDTKEEIRVPFDAPVRCLVADWRRVAGESVEEDPVVELLGALMHRGLREKHPELDGRIFCLADDAKRRAAGGA
jgi:hypothetical protein